MLKKKTFVFIILICCLALLFASGFAIFNCNNKEIFAAENNDMQSVKIKNDGTILTANLWKSLKRFYVNNKTEDMPDIQVDPSDDEEYLKVDIFKDFPIDTLDLSGKEIDSITNLQYFDLSAFTKINLSNNTLQNIDDELKNANNIEELNLSKNQLSEFSYSSLSQNCYNQKLQFLDISQNDIISCDLTKIAQGEINATLNKITKSGLKLPENQQVSVALSHNLIDNPDVLNQNISYGFQGVKDKSTNLVGTKLYYFGIGQLDSISIYKLTYSKDGDETIEIETEYTTLEQGNSLQLEIGYFRIKFAISENPLYQNIEFYIAPEPPTIKIYENGKEIGGIIHRTSTQVTIKFFGMEDAEFVYSLNGNTPVKANEVVINNEGLNNLKIYQIVNGYVSQEYLYYIEYEPPQTKAWISIIIGGTIFAATFFIILKYLPKIVRFRLGGNSREENNSDLD